MHSEVGAPTRQEHDQGSGEREGKIMKTSRARYGCMSKKCILTDTKTDRVRQRKRKRKRGGQMSTVGALFVVWRCVCFGISVCLCVFLFACAMYVCAHTFVKFPYVYAATCSRACVRALYVFVLAICEMTWF